MVSKSITGTYHSCSILGADDNTAVSVGLGNVYDWTVVHGLLKLLIIVKRCVSISRIHWQVYYEI